MRSHAIRRETVWRTSGESGIAIGRRHQHSPDDEIQISSRVRVRDCPFDEVHVAQRARDVFAHNCTAEVQAVSMVGQTPLDREHDHPTQRLTSGKHTPSSFGGVGFGCVVGGVLGEGAVVGGALGCTVTFVVCSVPATGSPPS